MRLVIDTNIWIHYLIQSSLLSLDSLFINEETELLFSHELLDEFLEVSSRSKFSRYFTQHDVSELAILLEGRFPPIEVTSVINICRDPHDNFLLALSKDGDADYLITGDNDLLTIGTFENTKIISLAEFEKLIS